MIQEILTEDVQEFVPYVFQILSLLLEYHNPGNITGPYMELFQFLLIPVLWERPGNIKPLVRLIQAYIRIGAAQVNYFFYDFLIFKHHTVQCNLDLLTLLVSAKTVTKSNDFM